MKSIYAAAACMIFAAALSGCSDKKNNQSGKKAGEAIISPRTFTFEWQEPYKAKLDEFRNSADYQESNGVAGSMFDIRDLNSDGIPELIISPSADTDDDVRCTIYTYSGESVAEIGEIGSKGFFTFYPDTNIITNEFQGSGFVMGEFKRITGTEFQTEMTYYNNMDSVESGAVLRYEIDKKEVYLAEYNEKICAYTEQPSVIAGRRFTFGDSAVDHAIYCSEGWIAAASSDIKRPELIFSEGTSVEDSCRIFVYRDGELIECSEKCGVNGRFGFDIEKLVFFTINPQTVDQYGSLTDISLEGYEKSDSLMECGRKYIVSDDTIATVFD